MMNNNEGISINPRIREKDERIAKLTRAVELLQFEKVKSTFLSKFMAFLSKNYTYEELLNESAIFFRREFKSTYAGIFLYLPDQYHFVYQFGTGYKSGLMPTVDESGSVMGETLHNNSMIVVEDIKERYFHVPLNQTPAEYNIICVPIITKRKTFVLRIANIPDKTLFTVLASVLEEAVMALARNLDHIHQNSINQQSLNAVKVSFSISRLIEKTLERKEILRRSFQQLVQLYKNQVHIITIKSDNSFVAIEKSDKSFYLGGTPASHAVYLSNLFQTYPDGNGFIENIHKAPRWSWPDMRFQSLNMAPLHTEGRLIGAIISISMGETFNEMTRVLLGLIASQTTITLDRALYFRQQEEFASKDGLTKLLNRRVFDAVLSAEVAVSLRYKRPLSIIMFDIDYFKKFNDVHGHSTGDEVLQVVAQTITKTIRNSDRGFRYGGEEFIILCPETEGKNAALLAERLRQRVEMTRTSGNLQVTISLGVTQYVVGESAEKFAKRVDDLLYVSKEKGRNAVTLG